MSTANFHTRNARAIYYMDEWSAEDFEEISWSKEFRFWGIELPVDMEIHLNYGYYEGANLDWEILMDGQKFSNWDCVGDFLEDWREYLNVGDKVWERFCKKFEKWIEDRIEECEKKCRKMCDEVYGCVGVFSNGEAIYERVSR